MLFILWIISKNKETLKKIIMFQNQVRPQLKNAIFNLMKQIKLVRPPSCTSIYCWWCCHPFSGPPCALPCDYKNDTFKVFGIFCSLNVLLHTTLMILNLVVISGKDIFIVKFCIEDLQ